MHRAGPREALCSGLTPMASIARPHDDARTFVALDGLRGFAALLVACRHAPFLWAIPGTPTGFLKNSYLAVDLFFVLSGFVLEYAYGQRLRAGMPVSSFMAARLRRLYPLYFLSFLFALPLLVSAITAGILTLREAGLEAASGLLMLPAPGGPRDDIYPLNYAAWSLLFELLANLVFALLAPRLSSRLLAAIICVSGICIAVGGPMGWLAVRAEYGALTGGVNWETFAAGPIRVTFSFFAGVALYRAYRRWPRQAGARTALVSFAVASATLMSGVSGAADPVVAVLAVLFIFPGLIHVCAGIEPDRQGLPASVMQTLGLMSYGVYVLQVPIFRAVEIAAISFGVRSAAIGIGAVVLVAGAAYAATMRFDVPFRAWLGGGVRRARLAAGTTPSP
jgi:peptidoglycan/LPS O-acetylase OafA/YrhL